MSFQSLIEAFQNKDIVKFRNLLKGFNHINQHESDMNIVFYEAILNVPRSDEFFGIFKKVRILSHENRYLRNDTPRLLFVTSIRFMASLGFINQLMNSFKSLVDFRRNSSNTFWRV